MAGSSPIGTAVLVHGTWGSPGDWQWVRRLLENRGVRVETPDLPSHRTQDAGLPDDVDEVRDTIRSSLGPVVVVGWSYGGDVIGIAADGEPKVVRLLYVSSVPRQVGWRDDFMLGLLEADDPHVIVDREHDTFVLNNDLWLREATTLTFPPEVREHIRRNPRRPKTIRAVADTVTAAAWTSVPTTVLLGRNDELVDADERRGLAETTADVREIDDDHFILFNHPEVIADVTTEALKSVRERG